MALSRAPIVIFLATATASSAAAASRPNVLFVVVDDLAPAFEAYGYPAKAPNLAKLAAESVQFRNAHVSIAVCSPSRTAFLTGLRPDTTQVWTIGPYFRETTRGHGMEVVTLPQLFRQHGYNTTGAGKIWHPGTPSGGLIASEGGGDMCPSQSPVQNCTHRPGLFEPGSWTEPYWFCDQYTNDTVQSPAMQQWQCSQHGAEPDPAAVFSWPSCGGGCVQNARCIECFRACGTWGQQGAWDACDCPDACYPEGVIAAQTVRVLRDKVAHPEKPWFHAMGFKRPHLSYRAPSKYFNLYDLNSITLPVHRKPSPTAPSISYSHSCQNDNHDAEEQYGIGSALYHARSPEAKAQCVKSIMNRSAPFKGSFESAIETNMDDHAVRDLRRAYYAVISLMDAQLGIVLSALEDTGLAKNTIVTFIGDHGYQNGEKGEWCKSNLFELATRIPMYVKIPTSFGSGWARGRIQPSIVESIDLYVTLADLAGLPLPSQPLGGESLRPLLLHNASFAGARKKTWALSQWPRRPSCTHMHGCIDGHGNPYEMQPDQAIMGYKLRTDDWAYICWFAFDWGNGSDPHGAASVPKWNEVLAQELYSHDGDEGTMYDGERFEWENVVKDPKHATLVTRLHSQLVAAVKPGLVWPHAADTAAQFRIK